VPSGSVPNTDIEHSSRFVVDPYADAIEAGREFRTRKISGVPTTRRGRKIASVDGDPGTGSRSSLKSCPVHDTHARGHNRLASGRRFFRGYSDHNIEVRRRFADARTFNPVHGTTTELRCTALLMPFKTPSFVLSGSPWT
jgi:hypothetical protein